MGQENDKYHKNKWLRKMLNPDIPDEMLDNKEMALEFLRDRKKRCPKDFLSHLSERLQDDPEVVLACVEFSEEEFQYASDRLKNDYQFALRICGSWIGAFPYVSEELRDCKEFVMDLCKESRRLYDLELESISRRLRNDREVMLLACGPYGEKLRYAGEDLRDCKEFVMELYRQCKHNEHFAFECISERLRDDEDVVRLCCQTGSLLQYANQRFWDDEEIVLAAYKRCYFGKKCISDRLRDDKEFIRKLCSQTFRGLENASARLQDDEELVLETGDIGNASERVQRNKDVILTLCKRDIDVISQVEKYLDDDDDLAEAILHHSERKDEWLGKLSSRLRDDKEYVIRWCEMSGDALQYASDRLRNDPVIVLTALNGHFPYRAPEPWLYLEYSITYPVDFYQHIGGRLRRDEDFAKIICDGFLRTSIGQKYRDDQQLMEEPTKVYWILEKERDRMTPDGIDGIRSVPDFHKGIDFTDVLKKLKEKTDLGT